MRPAASSEAQLPLPGVLDDLAGLAELTVPLASLRVVTSAAEGSLTLLNMVPAASELEKRGSRTRLGLVLWEKNSGDVFAFLHLLRSEMKLLGQFLAIQRGQAGGALSSLYLFLEKDN